MPEQKDRNGEVYHGYADRLTLHGSDLIRNHDMVHRRWCYRVSGVEVTRWSWAEGKTRDEVAAAAENGLKFCRSCRPLDHIPADVENRRTS